MINRTKVIIVYPYRFRDFDLGNLLDDNSTVESLWSNNDYLKIRNSIVNKNPPKLCTDRCIIYNKEY